MAMANCQICPHDGGQSWIGTGPSSVGQEHQHDFRGWTPKMYVGTYVCMYYVLTHRIFGWLPTNTTLMFGRGDDSTAQHRYPDSMPKGSGPLRLKRLDGKPSWKFCCVWTLQLPWLSASTSIIGPAREGPRGFRGWHHAGEALAPTSEAGVLTGVVAWERNPRRQAPHMTAAAS